MARQTNRTIFIEPGRRGRPVWQKLVVLAVLLGLTVGSVILYNRGLNRNVELGNASVSVMGLDRAFQSFNVLVISDLHAESVGTDLQTWQKLLYRKNYSAAVLCGDMVGSSGNSEPMLSLIHTLKTLRPDTPILFVAGDDDPEPVRYTAHGDSEVLEEWVQEAQSAGAVYLDAPYCVPSGKRNVWFVPAMLYDTDAAAMASALAGQKERMEQEGTVYTVEGFASYQALCYQMDVMERCAALQKDMLSTDLQIAVSHVPKEISYIRESVEKADPSKVCNFRAISLYLCGHYCGGQWCLPGGQPIYMPEIGFFPAAETVSGLQRVNSLNLFISPGLGASEAHPLPGRMFNKPGVTLLKFTSGLT